MNYQSAVVVGAGIGGLAAAGRLARAGYRVTVLEKAAAAGGRAGKLMREGYTFDTGPTLFLMPQVFAETYAALGERMQDHLDLIRIDPTYRVHFDDGTQLDLTQAHYETFDELARQLVDTLIGGAGLRRSAATSDSLQPGDVLDFWWVQEVEKEQVLLLRAEMKIGGEGLLGFYLFPHAGGTVTVQRALFRPTVWLGRLYWFAVYPLHAFVFRGLIGAIAERAEKSSQ